MDKQTNSFKFVNKLRTETKDNLKLLTSGMTMSASDFEY